MVGLLLCALAVGLAAFDFNYRGRASQKLPANFIERFLLDEVAAHAPNSATQAAGHSSKLANERPFLREE
jgi:hypothetical protein